MTTGTSFGDRFKFLEGQHSETGKCQAASLFKCPSGQHEESLGYIASVASFTTPFFFPSDVQCLRIPVTGKMSDQHNPDWGYNLFLLFI